MISIYLQSFGQTLAAAMKAARRLRRNARGRDKTFADSAWGLAEIVAPVGSDALGYLLDPINRKRCLAGPGAWAQSQVHERNFRRRRFYAFGTSPSTTQPWWLRRMIAAEIAAIPPPDSAPEDEARRWIWEALTTLSAPRALPRGPWPEWWYPLAAFCAFHFDAIGWFASASQWQLNPPGDFWTGFAAWHAGSVHATEPLLRTIDDDTGTGKRKAALLLLWTRSALTPQALVDLTRQHNELLRPNIEYRGSGLLPLAPAFIPSARQPEEVLKELRVKADAGDALSWEGIEPLVTEMFGAKATVDSVQDQLTAIRSEQLRCMVYGVGLDERQAVARAIMELATVSADRRDPREWTDEWFWDEHRREFKDFTEIRDQQARNAAVGELLGRPAHLMGLEEWKSAACDLGDRVLRAYSGGPIIGSQALDANGARVGDPRIGRQLNSVVIGIPPLHKRKEDIPYLAKGFAKQQISGEVAKELQRLAIPSSDDLKDVLDEAVRLHPGHLLTADNIEPAFASCGRGGIRGGREAGSFLCKRNDAWLCYGQQVLFQRPVHERYLGLLVRERGQVVTSRMIKKELQQTKLHKMAPVVSHIRRALGNCMGLCRAGGPRSMKARNEFLRRVLGYVRKDAYCLNIKDTDPDRYEADLPDAAAGNRGNRRCVKKVVHKK